MPLVPGFELIPWAERMCCKSLWFDHPLRGLRLETPIEPQPQRGLATSLPTDDDKYGICQVATAPSCILHPQNSVAWNIAHSAGTPSPRLRHPIRLCSRRGTGCRLQRYQIEGSDQRTHRSTR
jgi:hypothetical protein